MQLSIQAHKEILSSKTQTQLHFLNTLNYKFIYFFPIFNFYQRKSIILVINRFITFSGNCEDSYWFLFESNAQKTKERARRYSQK